MSTFYEGVFGCGAQGLHPVKFKRVHMAVDAAAIGTRVVLLHWSQRRLTRLYGRPVVAITMSLQSTLSQGEDLVATMVLVFATSASEAGWHRPPKHPLLRAPFTPDITWRINIEYLSNDH